MRPVQIELNGRLMPDWYALNGSLVFGPIADTEEAAITWCEAENKKPKHYVMNAEPGHYKITGSNIA